MKEISAIELQVGDKLKTAYSHVEVVEILIKSGWVRVIYKTGTGYISQTPFNFRKSQKVRILID